MATYRINYKIRFYNAFAEIEAGSVQEALEEFDRLDPHELAGYAEDHQIAIDSVEDEDGEIVLESDEEDESFGGYN